MKKAFLILCLLVPLYAFADIIATFKNGNITSVKVVSISADSVTYKQGDTLKRIASTEVEGVLYDDGRFVSPPSSKIFIQNSAISRNRKEVKTFRNNLKEVARRGREEFRTLMKESLRNTRAKRKESKKNKDEEYTESDEGTNTSGTSDEGNW